MIVPMKKATLYALKQDRDDLLLALQRGGDMMVVATEDAVAQNGFLEAEQTLKEAEEKLGYLRLNSGKKAAGDRTAVPVDVLFEKDPEAVELLGEITAQQERTQELAARTSAINSRMEQLKPWLPLTVPTSSLKDTRTVEVSTGFVASSALEKVKAAANEAGAAVELLGEGPEGVAVVLYVHKALGGEFLEDVKALGFMESAAPRTELAPKAEFSKLESEMAENEEQKKAVTAKVEELSARCAELELFIDRQATETDRLSARNTETEATFCITGWIPHDKVDEVKKAVESVTEAYELTVSDPSEEEKPPTLTKNKKAVKAFETITDMFSRPDPGEKDPNPVMAPWYWLIFGMMMADIGYGLIMAVLFFGFMKIRKPKGDFGKLVKVLLYCSISTAFWGIMFGSIFGETIYINGKSGLLGLSMLDDPITVMLICAGLGALHIFCGFILNMLNAAKHGDLIGGILDNIPWIFVISGLALIFVPGLSNVGLVCAAGGALVILLTAGRHKKGLGKVIGGLGGLYGIINHLSDILSYSRILALALSGAVVAMVMNILAGMVQGTPVGFVFSIVIYLIGHAFNLVMSLLSAYVHCCRLQYIEFFGKFYEGNGYAFAPMSVKNKYTNVV